MLWRTASFDGGMFVLLQHDNYDTKCTWLFFHQLLLLLFFFFFDVTFFFFFISENQSVAGKVIKEKPWCKMSKRLSEEYFWTENKPCSVFIRIMTPGAKIKFCGSPKFRNIKITIFMLTLAKLVLGNTMLKQQFLLWKFIVNMSLTEDKF